jgi:hypothetical protein
MARRIGNAHNRPQHTAVAAQTEPVEAPQPLPVPDVSRMGYNPANFAYWIGDEPWVPGYSVSYAISFYDSVSGVESARSAWWGPRTDPKKLYGGFGLIRIPTDPTGRATSRRIYRKFEGQPEKLIHEIPDNSTTKYQDDVR